MAARDRKDSKTMQRASTLGAILALGLTVGGCASTNAPLSATNNPSLYSVHQPVVQRTDYVIDLAVSGDRLADTERQRLAAWFDSIGVGYGDRISVDEPAGYGSPGARNDVALVADSLGLFLTDGAPVLNGEVQPGTLRVIASRATASVPGCPHWRPNIEPTNTTSSNYGCATNSNLAAMIANPEDLVLGQEGSTRGSATTATRAVRTYRERPATGRQPLPSTTTTTGRQ